MEIKKVDQGKDAKGYYYKYEIQRYDADGKLLSDFRIKKAITDFLYPVPFKIKKRKSDGYYEAYLGIVEGYRHIFSPVLN